MFIISWRLVVRCAYAKVTLNTSFFPFVVHYACFSIFFFSASRRCSCNLLCAQTNEQKIPAELQRRRRRRQQQIERTNKQITIALVRSTLISMTDERCWSEFKALLRTMRCQLSLPVAGCARRIYCICASCVVSLCSEFKNKIHFYVLFRAVLMGCQQPARARIRNVSMFPPSIHPKE